MHECESEIVCKSTNEKIPYFNAPIYLENKSDIGKVDEIVKDYKGMMDGTMWIYYMFCMGCGFSGIQANDRPLYGSVTKELCIRQSVSAVREYTRELWAVSITLKSSQI